MRFFKNPLYICRGISAEIEGLKQALSLSKRNNAPLTIAIITPPLPQGFANHQETFEKSIISEVEKNLTTIKKDLNIHNTELTIQFKCLHHKHPAINIIKLALQHNHDIIIKEIDDSTKTAGFKAFDLELLRKSHVPVWICRPIINHSKDIKLAVAIDATSETEAENNLSLKLLHVADLLAQECNQEVNVLSCWNHSFENHFRVNPYAGMNDIEKEQIVLASKETHLQKLQTLLSKQTFESRTQVHHIKGSADEVIPEFVKKNDIEILVMGTLGRTGIQGLMIGNTAENILHDLKCSVLAMKPVGFISPVRTTD